MGRLDGRDSLGSDAVNDRLSVEVLESGLLEPQGAFSEEWSKS